MTRDKAKKKALIAIRTIVRAAKELAEVEAIISGADQPKQKAGGENDRK